MSRRRHLAPLRLLAVVLAVGGVVALAFVVRGTAGTGSDDVTLPAESARPSDAAPTTAPSGSRTRVVTRTRHPITLAAGPGLVIDARRQHRLTAIVTSAAPLYEVGYLIPTSVDHAYGKVRAPGRHWTAVTVVTGKPAYAVIWVWAGKAGAPATCTISIDGTVRSRKTTDGPYGRQVCYA